MPKNVKLMLTENVDSVGIVGDVVNVRLGFARNFLLPRNMATTPSDEAIAAVAAKRAEAQRLLAEQRKQREALVEKLENVHINLVRSCNDLGHLYASVTQQEIATALAGAGYPGIRPRDVRLNVNIKRVDTYDVPIKFESDLEAHIKVTVQPDRKLDLERHHEPEHKPEAEAGAVQPEAAAAAETEASVEKPKKKKGEKGDKPERAEKPDKTEKTDKAGKAGKGEKKAEGKAEEKKGGGGWGTPVSRPEGLDFLQPKRERRSRK